MNNYIPKIALTILLMFFICRSPLAQPKNDVARIVKVALVIQDPRIPSMGNKKLHEVYKTPGHRTPWNDPWRLALPYRDTLNSVSGGVIDYKIARVYEDTCFFTRLRTTGEMLTFSRVRELLAEPDWKTFKETNPGFDYKAFIDYYGFCEMRDKNEIDEVWLWTFPYAGCYESTFAGKGAFWLNSDPVEGTACKNLLTVMGLNYEREMSLALESYGHRFESVMRHVYGRWECKNPKRNNWEIFTSIEKDLPGQSHIGNIHFSPNSKSDYESGNQKDAVKTYADNWKNYPNVTGGTPRLVTCVEWQCSHLGYMCWWYRHIPHFAGINKQDGHLNNWWRYVADYNDAIKSEKKKP